MSQQVQSDDFHWTNAMPDAGAFPLELRIPRGRGAAAPLYRQLREAILEGRLASGLRLPASRELAALLGISRMTVVGVYDKLVAEGYAHSRQGAGTFVLSLRRAPKPRHRDPRVAAAPATPTQEPVAHDFRLGTPDVAQFPFELWQRLSNRALRQVRGRLLQHGAIAGEPALREAIAGHVSRMRAVACSADDVVVTAGAQQAFDLLARTLLRPGRNVVAIEDPAYPPMRAAFAAAGARIVAVPVDREGIRVDRIPPRAAVVCVTPSHQFPLGVALSPERRRALLACAERQDAIVVEDDYDGEFRFDGRPLDALQTFAPQRVCYVGTFSKTMFPILRLGFVVVPQALHAAVVATKQASDRYSPPIAQLTLAGFIADGHLHRHVRRMQRLYAARRAALLDGLERRFGDALDVLPAMAGLHLAVGVGAGHDWDAVAARARSAGIAFETMARYTQRPEHRDLIPLAFALVPESGLDAALDGLALALGAPRSKR